MLSLFIGNAQQYHFFCVNIGENSDGDYIAGVINSVLDNMKAGDTFTIYLRGGVSQSGKIFDSEVIEDRQRWNEVAQVLKYVETYSVLPKPEMDNMMRLFQSHYTVTEAGLSPKGNITVYWFGDRKYYKNYGQSLFLKFYYTCAGELTWQQCFLCPDKAGEFGSLTIQQLLGDSAYACPKIQMKKR